MRAGVEIHPNRRVSPPDYPVKFLLLLLAVSPVMAQTINPPLKVIKSASQLANHGHNYSYTYQTSGESCPSCAMPYPNWAGNQWHIDHRFAHHLAEVQLRLQARQIMENKSELRKYLKKYKDLILTMKANDPKAQLWYLLEEQCHAIEHLILRVERLEGELKAKGVEPPPFDVKQLSKPVKKESKKK